MASNKIEIKDYSATLDKAKELERLADDMNKIQKQMKKTIHESESYWQGTAAKKARTKMNNDISRMAKVESATRSTAASIRKAVQMLKAADSSAASSIKNTIDSAIRSISKVSHR